ncbi:pleckstrin (PH) domain-containing protein [Tieghemostelium lacteum]|uniref:Pleckstrin (PH) domain-containing protein n=1 Tax=Tieghemostelium lacteum TaxID=361077 RepID=A0A151Z4L7_TIELA|nr:pleckstrin (PH) domain-containing protein [Tieghemostelium lacteum]|eukprot:KYQ88885.1 pleckstrin (PH) domain-containing protein [Tieghemostelium lacteum]
MNDLISHEIVNSNNNNTQYFQDFETGEDISPEPNVNIDSMKVHIISNESSPISSTSSPSSSPSTNATTSTLTSTSVATTPPSVNNNNIITTATLPLHADQSSPLNTPPSDKKKLNINLEVLSTSGGGGGGSSSNNNSPISNSTTTHKHKSSNSNSNSNGSGTSHKMHSHTLLSSRMPVLLTMVFEMFLGGGLIFLLVWGLIKDLIPLIVLGGYGALILVISFISLIGLYKSSKSVIILYYYWKYAGIYIVILLCVALGVLVHYDYLLLSNDGTPWWASVIVIAGIGFFSISWYMISMKWLYPMVKEIRSVRAVVLKEIQTDEEIGIPTDNGSPIIHVNKEPYMISGSSPTIQTHQPSSIPSSSSVHSHRDMHMHSDQEVDVDNDDDDDDDDLEYLDQMTPRPQYGVLQPEDPLIVSVRKFNKNPESGVKYILENNLLTQIKGGINLVDFLYDIDELNKVKVGEFLCGTTPYHKEICAEFVNRYDFKHKEFDEALREYLSKFRLPGEAQKIDRMMERFAIRYHQENPEIFPDSDTAYILAFSLIILNTDAHNPAIKNKMAKKAFVQNNTGFKGKKDLPIEYLEKLYDRIQNNELKMVNDSMFSNAQVKGWLYKMTSNQKKWQKRWFILKNNCLYYFQNEKDEDNPKVIIPLEGLRVQKSSELVLEIEDPTVGTIKSVKLTPQGPIEGQHCKYSLKATSPEETEKWLKAIRNNTLGSPVLLLIKKKKKLLSKLAANGGQLQDKDRRKSIIDASSSNNNNNNNTNNNNNNNYNNSNHNQINSENSSSNLVGNNDDLTTTESDYSKSKQTESEFLFNQ